MLETVPLVVVVGALILLVLIVLAVARLLGGFRDWFGKGK